MKSSDDLRHAFFGERVAGGGAENGEQPTQTWLFDFGNGDRLPVGQAEPDPYLAGDADCSGGVDIDDAVYLVNYIFLFGPDPCDPDDDHIPDC